MSLQRSFPGAIAFISFACSACNPGSGDNLLPPSPETLPEPAAGSAPAIAPEQNNTPGAPEQGNAEPNAPAPTGAVGDGSGAAGPGEQPTVPGSAGGVQWEAPASWRAVELASTMRLANWEAGPDGVAMQCALFSMPAGGSVDDNVQRWLGQFESDSGGPPDNAERAAIEVSGRQVTLVRASGVMLDRGPTMTAEAVRRPGSGLMGAIIPVGESTTFVKCTGPELTVQSEERNVLAFIRSLRFAGE